MTVAYVNSAGVITDLAAKASPFRRLADGERVLCYSEPAYDPELFQAVPVQPVDAAATAIAFTLMPLAGSAELRASKLLAKIDADVDDIYAKAVGNRGTEYAQAETEATAFQASGFTLDPVPPYVLSWASVSGMTPQQAAESILSQAHRWRSAALLIRQGRLQAKAVVRAGGDLTAWDLFVSNVRQTLGIG